MFRIRALLIDSCLACFDVMLTAACYLAILGWSLPHAQGGINGRGVLTGENLLGLGWILLVWLALLANFGMYRSRRMDSVFSDVGVWCKTALIGLVVLQGLARLIPALEPAPNFLLRSVAANFLLSSLARTTIRFALRELRRRGFNIKSLHLVAPRELGGRLQSRIEERAHYGYHILEQIEYRANAKGEEGRTLASFGKVLKSARVDDVIVALPAAARQLTSRLVEECENRGINVRIVPDLFPLIQSDTQVYDLDGIPLINVRLYPTESFGYVVLKRVLDVAVSLAVLTLFSPFYLLLAILVKRTSPGPVFFIQEHVSLNGRPFKMLKFRTMYYNPACQADSHWTIRNDPNVTPLGHWLRRANLDELPQFWNVLAGDMSLVGPRPERPFFIERFRREIPEYMVRHYVKGGITGWAQVNGWRGDTSIRERLAHDLYYMRHWALALDLKILLLTLTRTFFQRNAY